MILGRFRVAGRLARARARAHALPTTLSRILRNHLRQ